MASLMYHRVMPGETLGGIARQHYGDAHLWRALAQHNRIANPNLLVAGSFIQVPERLPGARGPRQPCPSCSSSPSGPAEVDDHKTQALIDRAMSEARAHARGDHNLMLERAFRRLQAARRVPGASLDMNLAAAEHYTFARWEVGVGNVHPAQMRALVVGYDLKKVADRLRGDPNASRTSSNPVSPPSADVVRWGLKGVNHGVIDHDRYNPNTKPPVWQPIENILGTPVY
jgi:LysM repeat protein